jgi:hypothetical protein
MTQKKHIVVETRERPSDHFTKNSSLFFYRRGTLEIVTGDGAYVAEWGRNGKTQVNVIYLSPEIGWELDLIPVIRLTMVESGLAPWSDFQDHLIVCDMEIQQSVPSMDGIPFALRDNDGWNKGIYLGSKVLADTGIFTRKSVEDGEETKP